MRERRKQSKSSYKTISSSEMRKSQEKKVEKHRHDNKKSEISKQKITKREYERERERKNRETGEREKERELDQSSGVGDNELDSVRSRRRPSSASLLSEPLSGPSQNLKSGPEICRPDRISYIESERGRERESEKGKREREKGERENNLSYSNISAQTVQTQTSIDTTESEEREREKYGERERDKSLGVWTVAERERRRRRAAIDIQRMVRGMLIRLKFGPHVGLLCRLTCASRKLDGSLKIGAESFKAPKMGIEYSKDAQIEMIMCSEICEDIERYIKIEEDEEDCEEMLISVRQEINNVYEEEYQESEKERKREMEREREKYVINNSHHKSKRGEREKKREEVKERGEREREREEVNERGEREMLLYEVLIEHHLSAQVVNEVECGLEHPP